jgi:predicted dehydrogenase/threonine dehydrogenase-like Zn-dependent dehydrogenase
LKQIVQNYRTGELWLEEIPVPLCRKGGVLIKTEFSVVSTGTERMKVDQARMSLLAKAKARPDQVRKVLQGVSQQGVVETFKKVQERLDALSTLGYSSAGVVVEVGEGLDSLAVGDRVACGGEGIACHAEYAFVPRNLCARIPDGVNAADAAFSTVGAIAINGVRQAGVALGDSVLVIGLGLVGLLAVQILRAAGCRVIGVDIDPGKLELALRCGAEAAFNRKDDAAEQAILALTDGRGVDAVYVAASSPNADPIDLAGVVARDRARVVIVGMVPVTADWRTYYAKELSIVLSRSYGPGRYDRNYELKGIDYPAGYVPWTLRRNLEEFLRLVQIGAVTPNAFGAKQFAFEEAKTAYEELYQAPGKHAVGMVFRYSGSAPLLRRVDTAAQSAASRVNGKLGVGLVGAGNFATGTLIPALKGAGDVRLRGICSAGGLSAKGTANRHGFDYACSDYQEVLNDEQVQALVIATRHDTHAGMARDALRKGKHVFVEKPLALNESELAELLAAQGETGKILMPGFNRRFSALSKSVQEFFTEGAGPLEMFCRVNAGNIGRESWYQDSDEGGWRIVSEGCHWIDLMSFISRSVPRSVTATMVQGGAEGAQNDNCIVTLEFQSGSIGVLMYVANGDAGFSKERIEVFGQQRVAVIDNWRGAELHVGGKSRRVTDRGGKGHGAEIAAFMTSVREGTAAPIGIESAWRTTMATFGIQTSLARGGVRVGIEKPVCTPD